MDIVDVPVSRAAAEIIGRVEEGGPISVKECDRLACWRGSERMKNDE